VPGGTVTAMTDLAPFDLEGAAAVVTGAGSGIGRAIARELAHRGARVVVTDIDDDRATTVAGEITAARATAVWQHLDVTSAGDFVAARDRCLGEFGAIDIVVNNVGTMVAGRPEQIPAEEWQRLLDVNLLGVVRSNEVFLPVLMSQHRGHVVNTSSTNGIIDYSYDRTPYAASKAAVMMLSEQLFLYLRPYGVGVSCLCPAGVITNIAEQIRPVGEQLPLRAPHLPVVEAEVAGVRVADAIEQRAFLVLTADEARDELRRKGDDLDAYLREREEWMHAGGGQPDG
jgi:NAD(P)-dependent dehydrogenase (short-subunit alcohol dehydrogenase family)